MSVWLVPALLLAFLAPQEPPADKVVYLDSLLSNLTTKMEGFTPYRKTDATFGNTVVKHGLSTEIAFHASVLARYSAITFSLDKRYETFEALIGRDNTEAALGQSYCFFEVYADGKRVYSSPAIRSQLSDVLAQGGDAFKVKVPQKVSIDVRNVEQLKLAVQLPNFPQKGYRVNRAAGCVWGDAKLTLKPGERPEIISIPEAKDQAARTALNRAVAALLKRMPQSANGEAQRLAVTPLLMDSGAPGTPELRDYTKRLIGRQATSLTLLTLQDGSDETEFLRRFKADTDLLTKPAGIASAARNSGADLVLVPSLIDDDGWKIELKVLETGDGATVASARIALEKAATPPH
ncbi:MAG: NPCBM/NEW2 domain-containing protein [Armatimonas sp.]